MYLRAVLLVLCFGYALSQLNACLRRRLTDAKAGGNWRGVNLGSWFVLEYWMASHLWKQYNCPEPTTKGSYQLEHCLGDKAQQVLERHWSTWITEHDFAEMARHGVNVARIPVGWWTIYDSQGGSSRAKLRFNVVDRNYTAGGLQYLDKAFEWGAKYGVGIVIDMHAAPGSQNGFDNSSPYKFLVREWDKYPDNINQTVESMGLYAQRYGAKEALLGFVLLNEPGGWNPMGMDVELLQDYYLRAYQAIRRHSADTWIILSSIWAAFDPMVYSEKGAEWHWIEFMNDTQVYNKIGMEVHYYSCFGGPGDQNSADDAIQFVNVDLRKRIDGYNKLNAKPLLVGEWSACMHSDPKRVPDFFRAQVDTYSTATQGWTFWSWTDRGVKSQPSCYCDGSAWSLKSAFRLGWIDNLTPACPVA